MRGRGAPARNGDPWLVQDKSVIVLYGVYEREVNGYGFARPSKSYGLAKLWMYGEIVSLYNHVRQIINFLGVNRQLLVVVKKFLNILNDY